MNGIYLDDMESGWTIEDNVFEDIRICVFVGGGRQNRVLRNEFVNCSIPVHVDDRGLNFMKCGPNASYPSTWLSRLDELRYKQPPWSTAFDIDTTTSPCAPALNVVRDNRFCFAREPAPPPPPHAPCARCSAGKHLCGSPQSGHWCYAGPFAGVCGHKDICCLQPGSMKKSKWGDDGCEGIRRCGNNPHNLTVCPPLPLPPSFSDYAKIANASWRNVFSNNTNFTCSHVLKGDDNQRPSAENPRCTNHSDCTDELQAALDSGAPLVDVAPLSNGRPWTVRPIHIRSHTTVLFRPGCHVQAKRFSFHGITDSLINIRDAHNVTVLAHGATFSMWKGDYTNASLGYSAAQWRHGFWVSGNASSSAGGVRVEGAFVTRTGGDGMQIEANGVIVKHFTTHDTFRQGISILGGRDVVIEDSVFSNTSGHAPGSGLQIEPWHSQNVVQNVSIRRCRADWNQGNGFCVAIGALNGSSAPTSVEISDCTTVGSIAGVAITSPEPSVRGSVTVRNLTARTSSCWGALVYNHAAGGNHTVRITDSTFDGDATVVEGRGCGLTAPIGVGYVTWQPAPAGPVGGVSVDRSRVVDSVDRPFLLATAPGAKYARPPYGIRDVLVSVSRAGPFARSAGCNASWQPHVESNVSVRCHVGKEAGAGLISAQNARRK